MDRGPHLGHGRCRTTVAPWPGRPGTPGGALLGVVGHGSLECLYLVSHGASTAGLGASVAGYRGHDGARGTIPSAGEAWRAEARQRCHWWHRVRDGTLAPASVAHELWPIRRAIERLLEVGHTRGVPQTEGTCRDLLKRRQALWTFVRHAGVDPTNHAAKRALRPGMLWRQGSFGIHSPEGSRFVDSMLTVVATLKQQHRNVLRLCHSGLSGSTLRSLLRPYFQHWMPSPTSYVPPRSLVPQVNAYSWPSKLRGPGYRRGHLRGHRGQRRGSRSSSRSGTNWSRHVSPHAESAAGDPEGRGSRSASCRSRRFVTAWFRAR